MFLVTEGMPGFPGLFHVKKSQEKGKKTSGSGEEILAETGGRKGISISILSPSLVGLKRA